MLRKFLSLFLAWGFSFSLLLMVSTTAISSTFTTSNFKEWLSKHKVYNSLVDRALSENKKETLSSKSGEVSFGDKEMRNAIKKTFTPKLLQDITEDFIDGVDPWLKGKTDNPTFKIDLSDVKSSLATNIASAYKKSYAKLRSEERRVGKECRSRW